MMDKGKLIYTTKTKKGRYSWALTWLSLCGGVWAMSVPFVLWVIYLTGGKDPWSYVYLAIFIIFPIWASKRITVHHRPVKLYEKGFGIAKGVSASQDVGMEEVDGGDEYFIRYDMIGYLRILYRLKYGIGKKVVLKENKLGMKILHKGYDELVGGEDTFRYPLSREMHEKLVEIVGKEKVNELYKKKDVPTFRFFEDVDWDEVKKGCEEYKKEETFSQYLARNWKHEIIKLGLYLVIPLSLYFVFHLSLVPFIFIGGICYLGITLFLPPTFRRNQNIRNAVFILTWALLFEKAVDKKVVPEDFEVSGKKPKLNADHDRNEFWVEFI